MMVPRYYPASGIRSFNPLPKEENEPANRNEFCAVLPVGVSLANIQSGQGAVFGVSPIVPTNEFPTAFAVPASSAKFD